MKSCRLLFPALHLVTPVPAYLTALLLHGFSTCKEALARTIATHDTLPARHVSGQFPHRENDYNELLFPVPGQR